MNTNKILGIFAVLILGAFYLSACQNNVNTTLEDSIAPFAELEPITGAQNATINVNRGDAKGLNSYFALDLSNIQSNGLITEGLTEGWCLDWEKPLRQNNDIHTGMEMYNTFGNSSWKPANYLMNIKDELKAADPDLTYREIQIALWSVIKTPQFNLDEVLSNDRMPRRMMRNGEPNFDVDKVKQIVSRVNSEVSDFKPKLGQIALGYMNHGNDDTQQPVGVPLDGSVWAYSDVNGTVNSEISRQFCGDSEIQANRWGWSNGTFEESSESVSLNLIDSAGGCDINDGKIAGTFTFTYEDGVLNYTVNLTEENVYSEIHIHAGNRVLPLFTGGGPFVYTIDSDEFGYSSSINLPGDDNGKGEFSNEIVGLEGAIYVAVHIK